MHKKFDNESLIPYKIVILKHTICDIASGEDYSMALTTDGKVYSWGYNEFGQLGLGDTIDRDIPTLVTNDILAKTPIIKVICCSDNSFILTYNGNVYSCGKLTKSLEMVKINCEANKFVDICGTQYADMLVAKSTHGMFYN